MLSRFMNTMSKKYSHWILIALGSLVWSVTMVKSGWVYDYGMGFWGANAHDGLWHVTLIESLARESFKLPILAGESIKNYHIGFDLILAGISKLTHIPPVNLYFQVIPPILAIAIGYLSYRLTKNSWVVFFVYFGGAWGWVFGGGESMFWAHQAISTLINPPFALSLIFILLGLLAWQQKRYIWLGILFGLLVQIKIYAAVLVIGGLAVAWFWDRQVWKSLLVSLLIAVPAYFLTAGVGSQVLVWKPFWYLETMMALSDRFNWPRFYDAMTNYWLGKNYPKTIVAYSVALAIFVLGNLGTRVVAIFGIRKNPQIIFYLAVMVAGLVLPMLFVQRGTAWNSIQFFYYSLFFASLIAGEVLKKTKKLIKILVIMLTIPTTFLALPHYLPSRPPAKIPPSELEALRFLRSQDPGVVLVPAFDRDAARAAENDPPRPLYLYESTAYVSALSGQPVYMEDEGSLNITGFDWQSRKDQIINFWQTNDLECAKEFLRANNIRYLYLPRVAVSRPNIGFGQAGLKNIFENSQTAIFKVE